MYLSGQINEWDGAVILEGPAPNTEDSVLAARKAAEICALNLLYRLREAVDGDLDRIDCILGLGGFVNYGPGCPHPPKVIDGATEIFLALFGENSWHAHTAVGAASLQGVAEIQHQL